MNNEQKGPISEDELNLLLNHNVINTDTLVWRDGFQNWIKFSEINVQQNATPPLPSHNYASSSLSNSPIDNNLNLTAIDPYYQEEFKKIISSDESYKGKWNWWGFLFSWIWCLTKGLWAYALIFFIPYLLLLFISFPLSQIYALIWLIIFGLKGTWFFYNLKVKGKQI